jgi:hypothetical protein
MGGFLWTIVFMLGRRIVVLILLVVHPDRFVVFGGFVGLGMIVALVFASVVSTVGPAVALEDGRVGLLYLSDPVRAPALGFLETDPLFSITLVAASLRGFGGWELPDVQRAVRLYMPRNYEEFVSDYDVAALDNANVLAVPSRQIQMIARGVAEGRKGLLMTGGWESVGCCNNPPWGPTSIGSLLPTIDVEGVWVEHGRVIIDEKEHEFISSLTWSRSAGWMKMFHHNLVGVKEGAQVLAHTEDNAVGPGTPSHPTNPIHPLFVTWELPVGARVFACTGEIVAMAPFLGWEGWRYYGDFAANLMLYLSERPVPQDVELVHLVRKKMFDAQTRRTLLLSLLEFIETFGANTREIMLQVDAIDEVVASAIPIYLDLRFEEVLGTYGVVEEMSAEIEADAVRLKNSALLWIYLVEWLAVSSTLMITGVVLWSIMVRRRLYKEVHITKFTA